MSVWVVALRELRAHRMLIGAALVLGLVPLAPHLVPGLSHEDAGGVRDTFGLFLGLAFPIAAAIVVGASLTSRDIADRRLDFYLARPLSATSLWAGKVLAGAVLVAVALLLVAVPTMIANGFLRERLQGLHAGGPLADAPYFLLFVMAGANLLAASYRMGSWLFAANVGLLAVGGGLFVHDAQRLVVGGAPFLFAEALPYVLGLGAIALLAPSAAQIAIGRSDLERGHRALSAAVWGSFGAALLGFHLWVGWLLGVTPSEVGHGGWPVLAAPRGSAFFFEGPGAGRGGYKTPFLMDGSTGAYVRLPSTEETAFETTSRRPETLPAFAPDGRLAVWVAADPWGEGKGALVRAQLGAGAPIVAERPFEDAMSVAAVSQSGEALLLLASDPARFTGVAPISGVAVVDVASGRVRARAEAPFVTAGVFLQSGDVRLFQRVGQVLAIVDWSPAQGTRSERTRIQDGSLLAWRGDSALVAARERRVLLDASGHEAMTFMDSDSHGQAVFLADGRLALRLGNEVRIVAADGGTLASTALDGRTRVKALRENAPGELAIGLWGLPLDSRRTLFVDAATGAIKREEKGLLPAGAPGPHATQPPEPGSFATRLYTDPEGALVELGPDGGRRVVVPAVDAP